MIDQLSLFDLMRMPPIVRPVDPDGPVVMEPDLVLRFADPKRSSLHAEISIHPAPDGLWMWSVNYAIATAGGGYAPGTKWGRFALSQADAIHYAAAELAKRICGAMDKGDRFARLALEWAEEKAA